MRDSAYIRMGINVCYLSIHSHMGVRAQKASSCTELVANVQFRLIHIYMNLSIYKDGYYLANVQQP